MIDYVNVMKNTDLDKLLLDYCRQQSRDALPREEAEPADYYLISKCIDGIATVEEKKRVDAMISRDPSLAELLEPIEELNADIDVAPFAKPVKVNPRWVSRALRIAACLAIIITGSFWLLTIANAPDDEIVVRSVKEAPVTNITNQTTNRVYSTDAEK